MNSKKLKVVGGILGVGALLATALYLNERASDDSLITDEDDDDEEEEGEVSSITRKRVESYVLKNPLFTQKKPQQLCTEVFVGSGKLTIPENFELACKKYIHDICMGSRRLVKEFIERDLVKNRDIVTRQYGKYEKLTYGEVFNMVNGISSGMRKFLNPGDSSSSVGEMENSSDEAIEEQMKVGIYLETCKEWVIAAHACWKNNYSLVTCYANLGLTGLIHIINECELTVMIVSAESIRFLDESLHEECPSLKKLIVVGYSLYPSKYYEVKTLYDLLVDGERRVLERETRTITRASPRDVAIIIGTTGSPKGVVLEHRNIIAAISGMMKMFTMKKNDCYISYLPLAHVFELVVNLTVQFSGACVGFGSPRSLVVKKGGAKFISDLQIIQPTIMAGVPRVYDSIQKGVMSKLRLASPVARGLFNWVLARKTNYLKKGINKKVIFEDKVFGKIRELVGGKLRLMISGGAPLAGESHYFLQAAMGVDCCVIQGYGLTETCAACCAQNVENFDGGSTLKFDGVCNVGYPLPCCEVKLKNVPELNYFVTSDPPCGELLIRGGNVCMGYYKQPKKTAEVFDSDGFFHTGDVARFNKDGSISIIDRKKNLVKLSQGEYVALEHLEMIYGTSPFCLPNGLCIIADSHKPYLLAIILLDMAYVKQWAKDKYLELQNGRKNKDDDDESLDGNPVLQREVLNSFKEIARKQKKKGFEIPKRVILKQDDIWDPDNGLLTASSKLKRKNIQEKYSNLIENLYNEMEGKEVKEEKIVKKYYYQVHPDFGFGYFS